MYWLRAPVQTEVTITPITPPTTARPQVAYEPVSFAALPGWAEDTMQDALPALQKSCAVVANDTPENTIGIGTLSIKAADLIAACKAITDAGSGTTSLRIAIEAAFQPYAVSFSGNPLARSRVITKPRCAARFIAMVRIKRRFMAYRQT